MLSRLLAVPDFCAAAVSKHRLWWQVGFAVAVVAILAVTVVRYVHTAEKDSRLGTQTRTAFLRWRPQIQDLQAGGNIYRTHNYPNPPIMALVLLPLTDREAMTGAMTWLFLKIGMAVVLVVWAMRLCGGLPVPAQVLAVVLSAHPLLGDLHHGNVNIFVTFLVLACLELFRRGWDVLAGLALGFAVACKVTPALFLPYFGWKAVHAFATHPDSRVGSFWRAGGRVLLGATVGLFLFLFAVPAAWLATRHEGGTVEKFQAGWDENLTLLESWFNGMVKPFLIDGKVTSIRANQSIPGVVSRLLTHEPSEVEYDEFDREQPKTYHNIADIGPAGARWVVRGCQAGFVLLVVLLCRADGTGNRTNLAVAAECGLIVLGMLLFSERTWKHHGTGLILPVAAIIGLWALRPISNGMKLYVLATLTAVTALTLVPSFVGGRAQDMALTYGTHAAAYLLLTAGVAVVLAAEGRFTGRPSRSSAP